jgi:hypothetical protein
MSKYLICLYPLKVYQNQIPPQNPFVIDRAIVPVRSGSTGLCLLIVFHKDFSYMDFPLAGSWRFPLFGNSEKVEQNIGIDVKI